MRGHPMAPWHCTLGRREFNVENTPKSRICCWEKVNQSVNMPGLSSHDYSSFIQEAKNTRTNQTSRDRCENLFPSVLLKTGQAMMCRQSLRANMTLSGAAGCSWALGVTAGSGQHSPGRVRAGQLQSHKAKPRELPAH